MGRLGPPTRGDYNISETIKYILRGPFTQEEDGVVHPARIYSLTRIPVCQTYIFEVKVEVEVEGLENTIQLEDSGLTNSHSHRPDTRIFAY